jgi:flagellar biosynthetic protein FliO
MTGLGIQSFMAVAIVLALVGTLAWMARRGGLGSLNRRGPVAIETAVPLGERRSLVIVAVEGRRLLLGLTPAQVSLVAELGAAPAPLPAPFEHELTSRS